MSSTEQQMAARTAARDEAVALRSRIRSGLFADQTAGAAPRCVQGNLVILPEFLADDFHSRQQKRSGTAFQREYSQFQSLAGLIKQGCY